MTSRNLSVKSRLDVIDTALQRELEQRALWYLLGLFFLTAAYEFGGEVVQAFAARDIVIPDAGAARNERKLLPARRLERLSAALDRLVSNHPGLRDRLAGDREGLAALVKRVAAKEDPARLQKEVGAFLNALWHSFHQPTWEDPGRFEEVNRELLQLLVLLKVKPDETLDLPSLEVGPKRIAEAIEPKRDLFGFVPE